MKHRQAAFTLIEVMVALTIVAIALAAILTSVSNNISQLDYLNNRSLAHLAAMNSIAETQARLLQPPIAPFFDQRKTTLLKRDFYLRISRDKSAIQHVDKITVTVRQTPDGEVLHQVTGYLETQ